MEKSFPVQKGNLLIYIFLFVELMAGGTGHATPSGRSVRHFVFLQPHQ